ncbi:MAG: hypothetical protein ACNS63_05415 [Candidatus Nitrospinota bacterium M3_3B_026]
MRSGWKYGKRSIFPPGLSVALAMIVFLGGGFAFANDYEITPMGRQDFSEEELRRQFPPKKVEPYPLEIESARALPDENKIILPPLTAKERSRVDTGPRSTQGGIGRKIKNNIENKWAFVTQKRAYGAEINVWQMAIISPGAGAISLHLKNVNLPKGAFLYTYGLNKNARLPYRVQSTTKSTDVRTGMTVGDTLILEYHVPVIYPGPSDLEPFHILLIYHTFLKVGSNGSTPILARSCTPTFGDCHNDICDHLSFGTSQKSVALFFVDRIVDGAPEQGKCTGTLMHNSSGDFTPFFLTAYHCLQDDTVIQASNEGDKITALDDIAFTALFDWHHAWSCGTRNRSDSARTFNLADGITLVFIGVMIKEEKT